MEITLRVHRTYLLRCMCSAPRQIRLKTRGVAEEEIKLASRLEATLPVTLRANGFSAIFSFSLRPNLISSCFSHISLAPIGRARASGLPLGNGAGRDPRNPGKRGKIYF